MPDTKTYEEILEDAIEEVIAGYEPACIRTDDETVEDFYSTCQVTDMLKIHGSTQSRATAIGFAEWLDKAGWRIECDRDNPIHWIRSGEAYDPITGDQLYDLYLQSLTPNNNS